MRGNVVRPPEHSLFSRQRTSSVEKELASTPYAFSAKPLASDNSIQRAKESLLNPFEDDINVRLAKQRLFGHQEPNLISAPSIFPSTDDFERRLSIFDNDISNDLSNISEISSSRTLHSRVNSEDHSYPIAPEVLAGINRPFLSKRQRNRALAEAYTEKFYRSIASDLSDAYRSNNNNDDVYRESVDRSFDSDGVTSSYPAKSREAFTVLPGAYKSSEDQESNSSVPSSFKVTPTVRPHRVTAFAIVGETIPLASAPTQSSSGITSPPEVGSSILSSADRVSPFRGKGFKQDPYSRHTTPRTSTNTSPQRSRSNSATKPTVSFDLPPVTIERSVTPPRNFIKENIHEIQELSNFNRERNEEIAQQKKIQEELEILQELGLLTDASVIKLGAGMDSRSRTASPSAILKYEKIRIAGEIEAMETSGDENGNALRENLRETSKSPRSNRNSPRSNGNEIREDPNAVNIFPEYGNDFRLQGAPFIGNDESFSWKPPTGKSSMKSTSKSLPQSKSGSPQHSSKIPKRQSSVSPPRKQSPWYGRSRMTNAIAPDGRFISNSTSSIYEQRVYSETANDSDELIYDNGVPKIKSKSSQNLRMPQSILKSKPPKSPNSLGPPPTSKVANSKRLSPIVGTPDRTSAQGTPSRISGRSKTPSPSVNSAVKIPNRPSKSLATSPNTSRAPSRDPSRGPSKVTSRDTSRAPSRDTSRAPSRASSKTNLTEAGKLKKGSTGAKPNNLNRQKSIAGGKVGSTNKSDKRNTENGDIEESDELINENGPNGKAPLKRIGSKGSLTSKNSTGSKPELKRTNSKTSITSRMSRTSGNEKPGALKRKPSLKNLQEKSIEENPRNSRDKGGKGKVKKRDVSTSRSTDFEIETSKQDNETQYDKLSQLSMSTGEKLIPLTKSSVVSMTTAAITAQPLDIAAKVTNQLPAVLEKARDKAILERNSSSDSIAAKLPQNATKTDTEVAKASEADKKNLQKTASKISLSSVKEEKEMQTKNGMKLIPIDKPLDPQVVKVKQKIENILKSNESSIVDIKEKIEKENKAASPALDKVSKNLEKVAEKIEEEVKVTTTTAVIEKVTEKSSPPAEKSSPPPEVKSVEAPKPVVEEIKKVEEVKPPVKEEPAANLESLNAKKNGNEKSMPPVENVPKVETPKAAEVKTNAELIVVKESVIKKDTLAPVVPKMEEKTLASADDAERVTEAVIRGEPDVEVQSGNVSPALMRAMNKTKSISSMSNGTSNGATNGTTNGTNAISNGTTNHSKLPHADSKGDSLKVAKSNTGTPVSKKNDIDVEKGADAKKENICKRIMGGCSKSMACCKGKDKKNLSKVNLIDEKTGKKAKNSKEMTENKEGTMSKLNCCKKKSNAENEMVNISSSKVGLSSERLPKNKEEESPPSGCMSCCKRKNKIRDSSADRRNAPAEKWYKKMCCGNNKKKDQDWADRRDSIMSQPPPAETGCCGKFGRIMCCKKAGSQEDSRRTSLFSKKRSLSQAVPMEDTRSKLDPSLIEHGSHMRGAIPALPISLAWTCLICNIVVPGLGTICSGLLCLCFGRPRFGVYDGWKPRLGAFLIDIFVGVGQLFTVLFCLVGWGWSIWWGTMMVKVAKKYRKLQMAADDPENPPATINNHRAANM